MNPIIIAVYGTLKRGYNNHHLLEGARFCGEDWVPGKVFGSTGVPVATPPDEGATDQWVKVELYEINRGFELQRLDSLEGHPHVYTRTPVKTRSGVPVEVYYWLRTVRKDRIMSGVWEPERLRA